MNRRIGLVCLIIGLLLASGCWDVEELNQRAYVLGTGVDLNKNRQVLLTTQVMVPTQSKGSGQMEGTNKGPTKPYVILSQSGTTTFDAAKKIMDTSSRKLYYGHNEVVIFSEELARKGLAPHLDWFERQDEFRPSTFIFIAKGRAENILLNSINNYEIASSMGISNAMNSAEFSSSTKITFHDFLETYSNLSNSAVVPRIELINTHEGTHYKISGLAVFEKDKLAGWLDSTATRGFLWINNKKPTGVVIVPIPKTANGKFSIEIVKSKTRLIPEFEGNKPRLTLVTEAEGALAEETTPVIIDTPQKMEAVEKLFANEIFKEMRSAVQFAQKHHTDIFGFGETFHRKDPKKWKELKSNWDKEFAKLEIKISVKTVISHTGSITTPTFPQ